MLNDISPDNVYLACGPTDMRKSIDGLAALVQYAFELDPFANSWFVFCNRGHNKLKILRWDVNGFWLYYRRLERGRFEWPACSLSTQSSPRVISRRQLTWLLDGLTLEQRQAHPEVHVKAVL